MKIKLAWLSIVLSAFVITACSVVPNPIANPPSATALPSTNQPTNAPAPQATVASSIPSSTMPACQAKGDSTDGGAPLGCTMVMASVPKGGNYDLGREVSLALDDKDDPMIAYVVYDPNGDSNQADSTLNFLRWDRAKRAWKEPIVVDVVGNMVTNPPNRQVALARDAVTGALGIAYMKGENQVWLASSADGGVSWTKQQIDIDVKVCF